MLWKATWIPLEFIENEDLRYKLVEEYYTEVIKHPPEISLNRSTCRITDFEKNNSTDNNVNLNTAESNNIACQLLSTLNELESDHFIEDFGADKDVRSLDVDLDIKASWGSYNSSSVEERTLDCSSCGEVYFSKCQNNKCMCVDCQNKEHASKKGVTPTTPRVERRKQLCQGKIIYI